MHSIRALILVQIGLLVYGSWMLAQYFLGAEHLLVAGLLNIGVNAACIPLNMNTLKSLKQTEEQAKENETH